MHHIDVIVPTYNRVGNLSKCIDALVNSNYDNRYFDLYIIDDGSTDSTINYLNQIQYKYKNIHYLSQLHQGPAKARNRGLKESCGDLVAFTDDDCIADKNWLLELDIVFCDNSVQCVGGKTCSSSSDIIPLYMQHVRALDPPISFEGKPRYLVTSNACVRRNILESLGGFNEGFSMAGGEDVELSFRLRATGNRIHFAPQSIVFHHYENSAKDFLKRYYRYGVGCRIAYEMTGNNEIWFSNAAGKLKEWMLGLFDARDFSELRHLPTQARFCLLNFLQRIMLYSGFLGLAVENDLEQILSTSYPWRISAPRLPIRHPSTFKTTCILQSLTTTMLPYEGIDISPSEYGSDWLSFLFNSFYTTGSADNLISSVTEALDLDLALKIATTNLSIPFQPSSPDLNVPESTRAHHVEQLRMSYKIFNRRCLDLVLDIMSSPDLAHNIEHICYQQKIDLNFFIEWLHCHLLKNNPKVFKGCSEVEELKILDSLHLIKHICFVPV